MGKVGESYKIPVVMRIIENTIGKFFRIIYAIQYNIQQTVYND